MPLADAVSKVADHARQARRSGRPARSRALFLVALAGRLPALGAGGDRRRPSAVRNREPDRVHSTLEEGSDRGCGADVALPRMQGAETCPVRALETWLRRARPGVPADITAAETIEGRLTGDGVYKILRVRAAAAKITVAATEQLSPHGLRAGTITEATLNGALDEQIMPHSRHKDASAMRGDRRRARIVVDNPARLLRPVRQEAATERLGSCPDPPRVEALGFRTRRWRRFTPTGCATG
jgi:hypothetical protein